MSIVSSFGLLAQEKIQTTKRLSSFLGAMGFGSTNALYELILGQAPPSGQQPLFIPHDHCDYGIALPRASVYSFASDVNLGWGFSPPSSGTWVHYNRLGVPDHYDHNDSTRGTGAYDLAIYVTPNMRNLEAKLLVYINTGDVSFRFHNRTTNTQSSTVATTGTGQKTLSFTDIPVKAGAWNQFDFEASNMASASGLFFILDMNIAETRTNSQPISDGQSIITSLTKP